MRLASSKVHFIGIGGVGMSGLAELLHNMGAVVSGSDLGTNVQSERLKGLGVQIFVGHTAEQIGDVDVVVYSSAVSMQNPEIQEARRRKIPIIPRAEVLAEIMHLKRGIAIGGSHGKTTTTSLAASVFIHSHRDPTVVVGGRLDLIKSTALLGQGEWLIAEADESDGSFTKLSPEIAIITNIDDDHLDHYKSFENLQKAFVEFAKKIPFYGLVIVCGDDPKTRALFKDFNKRILFYGFQKENDLRLSGSKGHYEVFEDNRSLGSFKLQVSGEHNALNALAALAAGREAGLSFDECAQGLCLFQGVDRRFHFKGEAGGVTVYDDYGHHPTEVRAVLAAFRERFPDRRLVVAFQPHRYSRTQLCWGQFLNCFGQADQLLLTDIYAAGEQPIAGIDSQVLVKQITTPHAQWIGKSSTALPQVLSELKEGDVFVTLGAGDIWKLGMEVLKARS